MTEEKNKFNQIYDTLVDSEEPGLNIREKEILHPDDRRRIQTKNLRLFLNQNLSVELL